MLGVLYFGPGRFGSEAIFVPRDSGPDLEEDDGYLICFVHDENIGYGSTLNRSPDGCVFKTIWMFLNGRVIFLFEERKLYKYRIVQSYKTHLGEKPSESREEKFDLDLQKLGYNNIYRNIKKYYPFT